MCDYETIESVNDELFSNLSNLVHMPFFRYFQVLLLSLAQILFRITVEPQVDLYRECPFWPDHGSCNDPGCAITSVDEVSASLNPLFPLYQRKTE